MDIGTENYRKTAMIAGAMFMLVNNCQAKNASETLNYWTADKLQQAEPLSVVASKRESTIASDRVVKGGYDNNQYGYDGGKPQVSIRPSADNKLFQNPTVQLSKENGNRVSDKSVRDNINITEAVGQLGLPYTSSRVFPVYNGDNNIFSADLKFPYRAVGKLFFSMNGANYICTAAVIKPRVILTAGHCVHSGNGDASGWATNFLFVPAYRKGNAPLGVWAGSNPVTTQEWYHGGGSVPNPGDYALVTLIDNDIDGVARRIGDVTGWLGVQTNSLYNNDVHMLGYPVNFNNGERMHQVTSSSANALSQDVIEYGGDMAGGASGGPWIQNFGPGGIKNNRNRIVGVTSYSAAPGEPLMGSSVIDEHFVDLINQVCGNDVRNCT